MRIQLSRTDSAVPSVGDGKITDGPLSMLVEISPFLRNTCITYA
jgi:hypothetical protein